MRWLPKTFVVHQWTVEANKLKLAPIHVSIDGMQMHLARPDAVQAFNRMAADALNEGVKLKIIWAYRSTMLQTQHFQEAVNKHGKRDAVLWVAPTGYSEHHTGWAIDIGDENDPKADDNPLFERTSAFRWLQKNARKYYFEMSFPKNNWQGVGYEPWHWRFVGTNEARSAFHPVKWAKAAVWTLSFLEASKYWLFAGRSKAPPALVKAAAPAPKKGN